MRIRAANNHRTEYEITIAFCSVRPRSYACDACVCVCFPGVECGEMICHQHCARIDMSNGRGIKRTLDSTAVGEHTWGPKRLLDVGVTMTQHKCPIILAPRTTVNGQHATSVTTRHRRVTGSVRTDFLTTAVT